MRKPKLVRPIDDPVVQRRLDALEHVIDTMYERKVSLFAAKTGISMTQVNQWFSGYRMMREKAVSRVASKTYLPLEFFDQPLPTKNLAAIKRSPDASPQSILQAINNSTEHDATRRAQSHSQAYGVILVDALAQIVDPEEQHAAFESARKAIRDRATLGANKKAA